VFIVVVISNAGLYDLGVAAATTSNYSGFFLSNFIYVMSAAIPTDYAVEGP